MITLSKTHLSKLQDHGIKTYPDECCGAMLGHFNPETNKKTTTELIEIDNVSEENKRRRFMIKPEEYKRVEAYAKENNLTLLGFYHSHPDHPAKPSETDLKYAWPFFSYIIISIQEKSADDIFSYKLNIETNAFQNENLKIE